MQQPLTDAKALQWLSPIYALVEHMFRVSICQFGFAKCCEVCCAGVLADRIGVSVLEEVGLNELKGKALPLPANG